MRPPYAILQSLVCRLIRSNLFLLLLLPSALCWPQGQDHPVRAITAVPALSPIRIDGKLTERNWRRAGTRGFIQREPDEGKASTCETEVWVCYDSDALYIAARMSDPAPDSIVSRLVRRDSDFESDWFYVFLDSDGDRLSGQYFGINPSGSLDDGIIFDDTHRDPAWDGVWDGNTDVNSGGWTAEFRIPFSQFRFADSTRAWGIDCNRRIHRRNELSYLVFHPRNDVVRVSKWAELRGLEHVSPPARLEIIPYAVATAKFVQLPPVDSFNEGREDPFVIGRDFFARAGLDMRVGLTGNFTLDGTLNPDFAQVEVDPAVVNLTAYETFYQEKRPFFLEGSSILRFGATGGSVPVTNRWTDPLVYFSRRIGAPPHGTVTHEGFTSVPDRTTILGAAKVSGKTQDRWSIAALGAVTQREFGEVDSAGVRFQEEVEPLTGYGVVRALKEFNESRQGLGVIGTYLQRDIHSAELSQILSEQALSGGLDGWFYLDNDRDWSVIGWGGISHVSGSAPYLLNLQQSPHHYFQRPDADHVSIDSSATALTGWSSRLTLNKDKGNWRFTGALGALSPKFETNDLGYHTRTDLVNAELFLERDWFETDATFRTKSIGGYSTFQFNFGGLRITEEYILQLYGLFINYWSAFMQIGYMRDAYDDIRTRGGPIMLSPSYLYGSVQLTSDFRKPLYALALVSAGRSPSGSWYSSISGNINWRPTTTLTLTLGPSFLRRLDLAQYVWTQPDPNATATYGNRYVFGTLDFRQLAADIRADLTFTPHLSLQLYVQPLIASGDYLVLKDLAAPGTFDFIEYDRPPPFLPYDPNFTVASMRANLVLRWEYLPGSTLYFVWTHDKYDYTQTGTMDIPVNLGSLMSDRPDNIFSLKLTYWWSP
jgi:hypothetical protein